MIHSSTTKDVPALVRCLRVSFDDDPVVNWFLRQDVRRDAAFDEFFYLAVARQTLPFGDVYHAGDGDSCTGVALWAPPGKWRLGWWEQLQLAPSIFRLTPQSLSGRLRVLRGLQVMESNHMQEPHVYLSFLCAHPSHRGRGVGHSLMEPMIERCDRDNLPIYLENTKPQNEAFYRRYGFEVLHQIPLSKRNAPYYAAMKRSPKVSMAPLLQGL